MYVGNLTFMCGGLVSAPFVIIFLLFAHYHVRRAAWRRKKRQRKGNPGFCPSASSLGNALQLMQMFHRPSVAYVLATKLDEEVEDEDAGGPEKLAKQLSRQLRQIRRGERIDTLVLRL